MDTHRNWTGERLETGIFTETTIEHLHRYALAMELLKGKKVLDIACGEGYGANLLSSVAASVTGVDIDPAVISRATNTYRSPNLEFLTGSATELPVPADTYEAVVSFETLEHISQHEKMLAEIKRVLKPGGLLLISTPDKKNYSDRTGYKNPFHLKELYAEEFTALLEKYFSHIRMMNQQIALSSVISAATNSGFSPYTGDFSAITRDDGADRLYCIALASDGEIPAVPHSVFNGRSVMAAALDAREHMVKNTASYKLGHALLWPFKMIRKLFTPKSP